ncbi:protein-glutamate O-methyltransferase CheR [Desulfosporosinus sp. Sb-LF]|uniref:CheR family methyltransferase n=1 Tax=Desulfosporosinus sp. Sb-LF TaxID=2560027 RepID=UPI00107FB826|nr:protein-glutamate O-methyltransferase CheR [Desulfosporosinus sp. Sb-LF]TGE32163.1 tetratricopeptide repeat protein [Desulfosporosinus sp. Sb-LF]
MNEDYWLKQLGVLISEKIGLHFSENRMQDLRQAVQIFTQEHGQGDTGLFIQSLIASTLTEQQIKTLSSCLTVGETYFFREMKSLEAFRDHIISGFTRHQSGRERRLRVWSAGCSSGEEPYTVAMLIDQMIPETRNWDIRIYGTDINLQALEKARRGVYTKWSFRGTPDTLRDRYFEPAGQGTYAVKDRFKDMVSFSYLNLATDDYPAVLNTQKMDVIFCRNVIMYFTPRMIQRVIRRMHRYLVDGGWLIVAPSETSTLLSSEFSTVSFEGATLYRKVNQEPSVHKVWAPAASAVPEPFLTAPSMWPETVQIFPEVFLSASTVPPREDNERRYKDALAAYQDGRYDEAVATLQMICPGNGYGQHQSETEGNVFALRARILANQGNLEQAVEWCEKAITKDKINPDHWFLLAMILMEQGQEKAAVQALKRSLYLKPEFIAAYYLLGTLALRENRPKDSNRYFRQAISLLSNVPKEKTLMELDGMTAGRLRETIQTLMIEEGI